MFVEQMQEEKNGAGDTQVAGCENKDYQTINTKRDVVILYENNVDENAEALSDVTPKKRPNQHVETIVYEEESESECSEISETYTKEDLNELCLINSEALDFINNIPSVETPLCHKQNKMKIKPSGFLNDYKKQNAFDGLYYNQLNNLNSYGSLLSTSLMDILCSNQQNDICYMDNLISHVQYIIEELKRISNGEYLSEKTKPKWMNSSEPLRPTAEGNKFENKDQEKVVNNKNLSEAAIVPYQKEKEMHNALKDVITVRSEINVKLLNKILGKKMIVKVPKLLCDPVTLFGELVRHKFIIKGETRNCINRDNVSRIIITSDLKYPITLSCTNINIGIPAQNFNIAILDNENTEKDNNLLAIGYENDKNDLQEECTIITEEVKSEEKQEKDVERHLVVETQDYVTINDDDILINDDSFQTDQNFNGCKESLGSNLESIASLPTDVSIPSTEKLSVDKHSSTSSSLGCSVKQINSKSYLNIKTSGNLKVKKKPSPTTLKIKSPYENNSHVIEEKKRKRLLKIRERREKSRNTLSKNKEPPKNDGDQELRSETKLLLTGKSSPSSDDKENRKRSKKRKNKFTTVKDTQSYMENMKPFSSNPSSSVIINNFSQYLEPLVSQQAFKIEPMTTDKYENRLKEENRLYTIDVQEEDELAKLIRKELCSQEVDSKRNEDVCGQSKFIHNIPPVNTPTESAHEPSKSLLSKECKNSIDKLYTLIKELANSNSTDKKVTKNKFVSECTETLVAAQNSMDTHLTIGDTRNSTIDKISTTKQVNSNTEKIPLSNSGNNYKKKIEIVAHMPKVTLPPKMPTTKYDKNVKNRRKLIDPQPENTLKAISQLLHKFDNVQKLNHKTQNATKSPRNACETIREAKKNILPIVSPKTVKPENVIKNNINIKDVLSTKGNISSAIKTQTEKITLRPKSPEIKKKEETRKRTEGIEMNKASEEKSLGRTRLDALAQPKKTHFASNSRDSRMSEVFSAAGRILVTKPQKNTSLIPQRIKNIISQNGIQNKTPDFPNSRPLRASPRTQEETERSLSNSPERKRLLENKKIAQTKNNSATNTTNFLKKSITAVQNAKPNLRLVSPRRNDFKKLQKPTIPAIAEQEDLAIPGPKTEPTTHVNHIDKVTYPLIHVPTPSVVTTEVNKSGSAAQRSNCNSTLVHLNQSKSDEIVSASDFKIDVFEDGIISTAVANTLTRNIVVNSRFLYKKHNLLKSQGRTSCSLTRLEKHLTGPSNGKSFCDQARFKGLCPKRSFQQIFVLQSGDTGSLNMKSILSQNTNIMPIISIQSFTKSNIDWTSETLSLHYLPMLHSMHYTNLVNTFKESNHNSSYNFSRQISQTESNPNINNWNHFHEVSNVCNQKDDNINKSYLESTVQSETISVLKDVIISDISTLEFENSIVNSVTTSKTCDKTTSMDILVDLLNEIKTIISHRSNLEIIKNGNVKLDADDIKNDTDNKILSISELGTLKKFESNSSIHSYFGNDIFVDTHNEFQQTDENEKRNVENTRTDKEVAICTEEKEVVNRCTDVPSQLLPVAAEQSITVSTSSTSLTGKTLANIGVWLTGTMEEKSIKRDNRDTNETIIVDQHLKLKRDILVTVYSFLVLSVFLALTYPDILTRL